MGCRGREHTGLDVDLASAAYKLCEFGTDSVPITKLCNDEKMHGKCLAHCK